MSQPWQEPLEPLEDSLAGVHKAFFTIGLICVVGFVVIASFGRLNIVSVATGEVTPSSQIQYVQHLEGGIVREILAVEGSVVEKGQELIVLDPIQRGADVEELQLRIDSLKIDEVRLQAEIAGVDALVFPAELEQQSPDNIAEARALFAARQDRFAIEMETQNELIIQRQQNIREIEARLSNARESLQILKSQVDLSTELLQENLTTQFKHLELTREYSNMRGRVEEDREAVKGAKAALKEAETRLRQISVSYQTQNREELAAVQRDIEEFTQRALKFKDSLDRTTLRAPLDGIVKTVHVSTLSGVVKAGDTVVELVPLDDTLIVEAELPTQDIGFIALEQEASIKLSAPELSRFGAIDGRVIEISPDTLVRSDGIPYYRVRIETDQDRFERGGEVFNLYPGAQVVASIKTGTRTVAEYILAPFISSMGEAMQER